MKTHHFMPAQLGTDSSPDASGHLGIWGTGLTSVHIFVNFVRVRDIYFYRSAGGGCPVEAFLTRLDGRQAQKIAWVLRLVKELPMVPT